MDLTVRSLLDGTVGLGNSEDFEPHLYAGGGTRKLCSGDFTVVLSTNHSNAETVQITFV